MADVPAPAQTAADPREEGLREAAQAYLDAEAEPAYSWVIESRAARQEGRPNREVERMERIAKAGIALREALAATPARAAAPAPPHSDGDECTGIRCANPEHGWSEAFIGETVVAADQCAVCGRRHRPGSAEYGSHRRRLARAAAEPAGLPLDAEQLAEALHNAEIACEWPLPQYPNARTCTARDHERHANAILAALASPATSQGTPERMTHGRHCPCSACARQDWSDPNLAPCGIHGPSCPPAYQPVR